MSVTDTTSSTKDTYTIGIDFGSLSGRAVVVNTRDGAELAQGVYEYDHAVMDEFLTAGDGRSLPPDWALQCPADYVKVLQNAVPQAIKDAGIDPSQIVGIGIDFTACTVLPVTAEGTPLCELEEFRNEPHAYVKLWKHHAAQPQADRINELAHRRQEPWINRYGGLISSEWEFAKALQLLEQAPQVYAAMDHWVEAADWITWKLCGHYRRNTCTAGYKGIYQDGGYPSPQFCAALNPEFEHFVADKLQWPLSPLGGRAGNLTTEAAQWTGLPVGIAVSVGNVDAHVTAPACAVVDPGQMVAIMGTSTCHVMNGVSLAEVPGMCGVVEGGIMNGYWGYEAGQSGVGDIFAWFVNNCVDASYHQEAGERGISVHQLLTEKAASQAVGEHGLIALDWQSGNRSVLVNHELSGLLVGMTLQTKPEDIYRALLEATAFGTRVIIEAFRDCGQPVEEFVVAGGLLKNEFLMQLYADITQLPLSTIISNQGPALGAAIHAAVAAGIYPDVRSAGKTMGGRIQGAYHPDPLRARQYDELFSLYREVHDAFGRGQLDTMHRLKQIRRDAHRAN